MKKITLFGISAVLGLMIGMSTSSVAFSLAQKAANPISFSVTGLAVTRYYLKGSFNSWATDNQYEFIDNTASMDPETNKIKEYKLENIELDMGETLKVWGDNDEWYSTFAHHWNNPVGTDYDGNYQVPITSMSYSFYLKFFNNGTTQLYITANKDVIFFIPSNNWKIDDATIKMAQCDDEGNEVNQLTAASINSGVYRFNFGSTYTKYKFLRRSADDSTPWNQSNVQTINNTGVNNCFSLYDTYWGTSDGVWSDWDTNTNAGSWSAK